MNLEEFRAEAREWLLKNAPKSMFEPIRSEDELCWGGRKANYPPDVIRWLQIAAERGWAAPSWPREYGGGGLTALEARMLFKEMRNLGVRLPLTGIGLTMIGPLLLHEGTAEQKEMHLPRIARGEIRWCQGYSEPGAGSDLAAVQTQAVVDGDEFVVDGQKVWTSYADKADWMFLLVRTERNAPKHQGITFLLLDMDSPGVSVKPIRLISGSSPFCQTFLNNVRVPRANVVGRLNEGWSIAKKLLAFERTMIADVLVERDTPVYDRFLTLARRYVRGSEREIADPLIRDRITQVKFDQICFDLTLERSKDAAKAGRPPGTESSIFKLYGSELNKRRHDLAMSILGPQRLGSEGDGFEADELRATRDWLRSRGNSIEGGTSEIQLNIIAKRVLGLPD